jgi:hypothetical protein
MQCLETKGSSISTYLITSYFTPPLASMDTNSLNTCISSLLISSISLASHHFLFHPYHHFLSLFDFISSRGEAEGFTRKIALLEGELVEARQARDMTEVNSWGLSDTAADADLWWDEVQRECQERVQELSLL